MIPADLKYTEEHEWVRVENEVATVGITQHAVDELGEIVFVDLPEVGRQISQMNEFGSVESVKTISSLYLPISGEIVEVNKELEKNPGYVNESPYEDGWLVKVAISDEKEFDDLLTAEEYSNYLETL
ncbi:glycine cleavage system protein GcvH [bacterium]|nr:glycine cleavage system protein GcvH [bacterium]